MPFVVKADKGDKARIELPDGTNVVLNSASQMSYLNDFGKKTGVCNSMEKLFLRLLMMKVVLS